MSKTLEEVKSSSSKSTVDIGSIARYRDYDSYLDALVTDNDRKYLEVRTHLLLPSPSFSYHALLPLVSLPLG
jgi:hypothetical protein